MKSHIGSIINMTLRSLHSSANSEVVIDATILNISMKTNIHNEKLKNGDLFWSLTGFIADTNAVNGFWCQVGTWQLWDWTCGHCWYLYYVLYRVRCWSSIFYMNTLWMNVLIMCTDSKTFFNGYTHMQYMEENGLVYILYLFVTFIFKFVSDI